MPSFIKPNSIADAIMQKKSPEGETEGAPEEAQMDIGEEGEDEGLNSAAHDLMMAIKNEDTAGIAQAFKSAFQILESGPHEEYTEEPGNEEQ